MPSFFWAVLAGTALLGGAVTVHLFSGRELARTRANLLDALRHFERRDRPQDHWESSEPYYQQRVEQSYQTAYRSQRRPE